MIQIEKDRSQICSICKKEGLFDKLKTEEHKMLQMVKKLIVESTLSTSSTSSTENKG